MTNAPRDGSIKAQSVYLDDLGASIMAKPGPLPLVATDIPGGAGKSTFASALSAVPDRAPVKRSRTFRRS